MAEIAKQGDDMTDFPGLQSNADARNLPSGAAADQRNLQCLRLGELTCRPGFKVVTFEE